MMLSFSDFQLGGITQRLGNRGKQKLETGF
jgi:hypothetical protein